MDDVLTEKVARAIAGARGEHWFGSERYSHENEQWFKLARAAIEATGIERLSAQVEQQKAKAHGWRLQCEETQEQVEQLRDLPRLIELQRTAAPDCRAEDSWNRGLERAAEMVRDALAQTSSDRPHP